MAECCVRVWVCVCTCAVSCLMSVLCVCFVVVALPPSFPITCTIRFILLILVLYMCCSPGLPFFNFWFCYLMFLVFWFRVSIHDMIFVYPGFSACALMQNCSNLAFHSFSVFCVYRSIYAIWHLTSRKVLGDNILEIMYHLTLLGSLDSHVAPCVTLFALDKEAVSCEQIDVLLIHQIDHTMPGNRLGYLGI